MKKAFVLFLGLLIFIANIFSIQASRAIQSQPSKQVKAIHKTFSKPAEQIVWHDWSDNIFTQAKQSNRLILLDLEAIWCHWCHVMNEKTYKDSAVIKLINEHFIAVRVDQDSRPDLSNRYSDYGWPATVVFAPNGEERAIWSGYIPSNEMLISLQAALKGKITAQLQQVPPTSTALFLDNVRQELEKRHNDSYDTEYGGWGSIHKFLDADSVDYALAKVMQGDTTAEKQAKETLAGELKLIDPVWGGVYQYSTDGDWAHPHFEKIMAIQAENLRIYAQAYAKWHDPVYLKAAQAIENYLRAFLMSPEGAFYTSQDADVIQGQHSDTYFALTDLERRKRGMPKIDKHIYARENGWAINALVNLYMATDDQNYLDEAQKATNWLIANRSLPCGGFKHDVADKAGPYLGDTLSMGRAFLSLYTATTDKKWLEKAKEAADFINKHFSETNGTGFATADLSSKAFFKPTPLLDENVALAHFANLLFQFTNDKHYRAMAEQAMRYLVAYANNNKDSIYVAGILLADKELKADPAHVTVVGSKQDPQARLLFLAALKYPGSYKRIEWWDAKEGPLPSMDVEYPQLKDAAAFLCIDGRCSSPIYKPDAIITKLTSASSKSHVY